MSLLCYRYNTISVCHGINTPGMKNQIHEPKVTELDHSTEAMRTVLDLIPTDGVKLVTIARSNRDGFTPRKLQPKIEEHVLRSLRDKFKTCNIIFDPNLMLHLGQGIGSVT